MTNLTTTTTTTTTVFQQFEQFRSDVISISASSNEHYNIVSNEHGATIMDMDSLKELEIANSRVFFAGEEGCDQAEQYIRETTPCSECGSIVEVSILHTPAGAVPTCFTCIW